MGKKQNTKSTIPYDPDDLTTIEKFFWCDRLQQHKVFMGCPSCEVYPCAQLTIGDLRALRFSPLMETTVSGLEMRRKKLNIAKFADGTLKEVYFDTNNPNIRDLDQIEEVYVITKVLVPTVVLKPKPKEERDAIKAGSTAVESTTPKRRRRKKVAE